MHECCLSVYGAMFLEDIKNPIGLILVDAPSSEKTTVLSFFYPTDNEDDFMEQIVYKTDAFTPKSFVTHAANVKADKLDDIDLLPRIKDKIVVVPELAPIFSKREEDLMELIGILTRVFDGEGLQTDSGVRGRRGYKGEYFFTLMGATTPFDRRVWRVMGKLGSRLLFLTVQDGTSSESRHRKLIDQLTGEYDYGKKVEECRAANHRFMESTYRFYKGIKAVRWDRNRDDDRNWADKIALIAEFVARARSYVSVWGERDKYDFKIPVLERPIRLASILYNLARGHALLEGRASLSEADIRVAYEVGLSSMPYDHRQILSYLTESDNGEITASDIAGKLKVSTETARKIMETLSILNICTRIEKSGRYSITLIREFRRFTSPEFRELRFDQDSD